MEREKALELAVAQIEKQFGKGAIMKMGEASSRMAVDVIPTGALAGYSLGDRRIAPRQGG